jgi:AraC family cel operon transcriptional repressor
MPPLADPAERVRRVPLPSHLTGAAWIQVVRIHYRPGDSYDLHDHPYAEVFWIERGVAHHRVNGVAQRLGPGSLVLMRPQDAHTYAAPDGFVMVNVTFRSELLESLRERFANEWPSWPWGDGPLPLITTLDVARIERLQEVAEQLADDHTRLAAEGFLVDLLRLLRRAPSPDLPPWLEVALDRFRQRESLASGPEEFSRLCGRTPAHVNRAVQAAFGITTTTLVNRIRLEAAARALKLSDEGIAGIAAGCGFASLAHFYRAFGAQYGITPKAFRHGHHAVGRAVPLGSIGAQPVALTHPTPVTRPATK